MGSTLLTEWDQVFSAGAGKDGMEIRRKEGSGIYSSWCCSILGGMVKPRHILHSPLSPTKTVLPNVEEDNRFFFFSKKGG